MGPWLLRLGLWGVVLALVAVGAASVTGRSLLLASLPRESGEAVIPGLKGPVDVMRDSRGVPVIRAAGDDFAGVATALGFVHAQERLWQMDTMRRLAAGELSALIGPAGLATDKAQRLFRFREVACDVLARLPEEHRRWIASYTAGVNAGVRDRAVRPPEYLALGRGPAEWLPEDCVLVVLAMHQSLAMGANFEWRDDAIREVLGGPIAEFLMPDTSRLDAPLLDAFGDPDGPDAVPEFPRDERARRADAGAMVKDRPPPIGSNNWAVSGARTRDGRAILANDMHLQLMVPGTWFHAQLEWGSARPRRRVVGVTLPGVPGMVVGSNGRIAWGFTNVTGDFEDFVRVEVKADDASKYRAGPNDEWESFGEAHESIAVAGAEAVDLVLRTTKWGVVTRRDAAGRPLVLRWPALDAERVNLAILGMMTAESMEEAAAVAASWHGPPQNVAIASADGRIGWVMSGWIPGRRGFDSRSPAVWAEAGVGWTGALEESLRPRVIDPADGAIFTANARTLPLERARLIGRCWASGERQRRIAEVLRAGSGLTEADLWRLQLDTEVPHFGFYRDLILKAVPPKDGPAEWRAARRAVESWDGRADADSVGFRVINGFRRRVLHELIERPLERVSAVVPDFNYWWFNDDEPLMRLIEERPASWLPAQDADWPTFFRRCWTDLLAALRDAAGPDPATWTWGRANRARIKHGLSRAVPLLGRWLDMPADELSGHASAVRAVGRSFGASERLVVSPGHEEDGILHLPCGQSGHPLSSHYADGHAAWVRGEPRPLLAGEAISRFRLVPASR
jgi:penicillin amidase